MAIDSFIPAMTTFFSVANPAHFANQTAPSTRSTVLVYNDSSCN